MEAHANYLLDLGRLLRDEAVQARDAASSASATEFDRGQRFALFRVLSLMQQQAVAFDLPLTDLSLDGIDPERDLL